MDASNIENVRKVDLDNVLDQFGIFKRYHVQVIILIFISLLFNGMYSMNYVFVAEEVSYRCKDDLAGDYCNPSNSTQKCLEWVYDDPDSFFAYFQLACQEWKRTLVGTIHSIGYMCGLLLIGPMSDRFGRKPIAVITGVLGAAFGTLRSFSPWYWFYIVMEFLEGAIGDNCSPLFILNLPWLSLVFYLGGKLMCCFFFYMTYVYTVELFPTYTRNSMQALCSSIGRLGSIVAPQTPLLRVYWSGLPSFVFGVAALVAALSTFLVPDIADDALPDTVRQAEALGKSNIPSKSNGTYNEGSDTQI